MVIYMLDKAKEIFEKNYSIEYGWVDKKGVRHHRISKGLIKHFCFQTPEQVEKSRIAICWEKVELDRYCLEQAGIPCKTYFFVEPSSNFYCHSVLVFEENNKFL